MTKRARREMPYRRQRQHRPIGLKQIVLILNYSVSAWALIFLFVYAMTKLAHLLPEPW